MRISDWSSDVCSSDLDHVDGGGLIGRERDAAADGHDRIQHRTLAAGQSARFDQSLRRARIAPAADEARAVGFVGNLLDVRLVHGHQVEHPRRHLVLRACAPGRSEEHTSELQSLMRISYAVSCLKKKKK